MYLKTRKAFLYCKSVTWKGDEAIHSLRSSTLSTPMGDMVAIADEEALYLLDFASDPGLESKMRKLQKETNQTISPGKTAILDQIEEELKNYFLSKGAPFSTPFVLIGTPFQQQVWSAVKHVPLGETRSYAEIAKNIGNPKAVRAVGSANGANLLTIVIPCHRIIGSHGQLGGYASGLCRKKRLLDHEAKLV